MPPPAVRCFLAAPALLMLAVGAACSTGSPPPPSPADAAAAPRMSAPDLRFKWVGSGFRLTLQLFTNGGSGGRSTETRTGPLAPTPLLLSGEGSSYYGIFSTDPQVEPMVTIIKTDETAGIDADLDGVMAAQSIVASLDCGDLYNAAVNGTVAATVTYPATRATVAIGEFPGWVTAQGARGSVVTALCPRDGALYATAFGRSGDPTTYETKVAITALDGVVAGAEALGSEGYFITAVGRDGSGMDAAGRFVLVGTRAAGQTEARMVKAVDLPCVFGAGDDHTIQALFDGGYALVGYIFHGKDCDGRRTWLHIAQR
jgi:hypothetical protein